MRKRPNRWISLLQKIAKAWGSLSESQKDKFKKVEADSLLEKLLEIIDERPKTKTSPLSARTHAIKLERNSPGSYSFKVGNEATGAPKHNVPITSTSYCTKKQIQKKAVLPPGVKDLDPDDLDDPLMVSEYGLEIFEYLRELEVNTVPNSSYMDGLEWDVRGTLIAWLMGVHTDFHLLPETLFLAVNLIDRFLSERAVQPDRLQLVGVTALFIASKYEEMVSPRADELSNVIDKSYSKTAILAAERVMLRTLNYTLCYPNPMNFLRRISKADNYNIQCRAVGKYLMEITLLDHRFMTCRPSYVAAGAMYLSRLILDRGGWDETIAFYAGYTEDEIQRVVRLMVDYLVRTPIHAVLFDKYATDKFFKASIIARDWAMSNAYKFGIIHATSLNY